MNGITLLDLLWQGYYATLPLLLCSVLAIAVAAERLWSLRGVQGRTESVARQVAYLAGRGDLDAVATLLASDERDPLGLVLTPLVERARLAGIDELHLLADGLRMDAMRRLRRGVWLLGTIGSAAPFIGLFGTVVGIMRAFHDMAVAGTGGFAVVAAGISEALVATALGLAVAIVAVALYNYLQVRLGELTTALRVAVVRFLDGVAAHRSIARGGRSAA